jgi:hypothetical protein
MGQIRGAVPGGGDIQVRQSLPYISSYHYVWEARRACQILIQCHKSSKELIGNLYSSTSPMETRVLETLIILSVTR